MCKFQNDYGRRFATRPGSAQASASKRCYVKHSESAGVRSKDHEIPIYYVRPAHRRMTNAIEVQMKTATVALCHVHVLHMSTSFPNLLAEDSLSYSQCLERRRRFGLEYPEFLGERDSFVHTQTWPRAGLRYRPEVVPPCTRILSLKGLFSSS